MIVSRANKLCFLTLTGMVLSACSTTPRIEGSAAAQLDSWSASGRLGVVSSAQSGSGRFDWQQRQAVSRVQLRGPVGIGALQMELDGTQLRLRAGDGGVYDADAALDELEQRLGVRLPVAQLRYWLIGQPAPGAHEWSNTDEQERVLLQDGWRIRYQRMLQQGTLQLPEKLTLAQGEVQIRAVIERWQLN